jgi:hypothetical protein
MSLDASVPHRMIHGASAVGTRCRHRSQITQSRGVERPLADSARPCPPHVQPGELRTAASLATTSPSRITALAGISRSSSALRHSCSKAMSLPFAGLNDLSYLN